MDTRPDFGSFQTLYVVRLTVAGCSVHNVLITLLRFFPGNFFKSVQRNLLPCLLSFVQIKKTIHRTWLFSCAARSFKVVIHEGDTLDELCLPVRTSRPIPPGGGRRTLINPSTSVVMPGNKPCNFAATLAGTGQNYFGLAAEACIYDSASSALRAHRNNRQRIADTEPRIFSFVIALERSISRTAGAHQPRTYCGYIDVVFQEFRTKAFRKTGQGEFSDAIGNEMGHTDFAANRRYIYDASLASSLKGWQDGHSGKIRTPEVCID